MANSTDSLNFDQEHIRLIVGVTAIALPIVTPFLTRIIPGSVSASYYTNAHDFFVGTLFAIGALLICYKGRKWTQDELGKMAPFWRWLDAHGGSEARMSTWGGVAAWFTALFPTVPPIGCDEKVSTLNNIAGWLKTTVPQIDAWSKTYPCGTSYIHYTAAVILFSIVVYFCLFVFRVRAATKIEDAKEKAHEIQMQGKSDQIVEIVAKLQKYERRLFIYKVCGLGIIAFIGWYVLAQLIPSVALENLTFVMEFFSLLFFGIAWMVASKQIPGLSDKSERENSQARPPTTAGV